MRRSVQDGAGAPAQAVPIPRRSAFLMGNGELVIPRQADAFCDGLVEGCLDGAVKDHHDFVLGFAACFDAVSRGTIRMDAHPLEVVARAWADINDISPAPNDVTDIMGIGG